MSAFSRRASRGLTIAGFVALAAASLAACAGQGNTRSTAWHQPAPIHGTILTPGAH